MLRGDDQKNHNTCRDRRRRSAGRRTMALGDPRSLPALASWIITRGALRLRRAAQLDADGATIEPACAIAHQYDKHCGPRLKGPLCGWPRALPGQADCTVCDDVFTAKKADLASQPSRLPSRCWLSGCFTPVSRRCASKPTPATHPRTCASSPIEAGAGHGSVLGLDELEVRFVLLAQTGLGGANGVGRRDDRPFVCDMHHDRGAVAIGQEGGE